MVETKWQGVMPAITTPFTLDGRVDHTFLAEHARILVDAGSTGLVPLGSLGEGATLDTQEKLAVISTLIEAVGDRVPIIPGIAALSTQQAVDLAKEAQALGCGGLMALPPYVYQGDVREMENHVLQIARSTELDVMLYNNPVAYGTDFKPHRIAALAKEQENFKAVKDSSGDVRRITAIKALVGDRLAVFVGLDDCAVEGLKAGATGWIAGLVNAFPQESMRLFALARNEVEESTAGELEALYAWFLPLLRLDTVPAFVQLIKLVQAQVDLGSARVRAPRLELVGPELAEAMAVIEAALRGRSS